MATYHIAVEVTQLSQPTFDRDGTLGNRKTQDYFGLRLLEDLNNEISSIIPNNINLMVGLWVPVPNVARYRKGLFDWAKQIALAPENGYDEERELEGARASIKVIHDHPTKKKVVGFVANSNSSADIGLNARLILEERIRTKSVICDRLPKPVWLALLNDYWLADADSYILAGRQIYVEHCFERIFLVSDAGVVNEIAIEA